MVTPLMILNINNNNYFYYCYCLLLLIQIERKIQAVSYYDIHANLMFYANIAGADDDVVAFIKMIIIIMVKV